MAMEVLIANGNIVELLPDARVGLTVDGYVATRKFIVNGLDAIQPESARLVAATQAGTRGTPTGIPRFGDQYPIITGFSLTAMFCANVTAQFCENCTKSAYVTCEYRRQNPQNQKGGKAIGLDANKPTLLGYRFSTTTNSGKQFLDKDGKQMILNWTTGGGPFTIDHPDQPVEFDVLQCQLHLQIKRMEDDQYVETYMDLTGKVNSDVWPPFVSPKLAASRTWLCIGVDTTPRDVGQIEVDYRFLFRAKTWDETAIYKDPETNSAINLEAALATKSDGLTPSISKKLFELLTETDFSKYNLW